MFSQLVETAQFDSLFLFVNVLFVKIQQDIHRPSGIRELIEDSKWLIDGSNTVYEGSKRDIEAEKVPDDQPPPPTAWPVLPMQRIEKFE